AEAAAGGGPSRSSSGQPEPLGLGELGTADAVARLSGSLGAPVLVTGGHVRVELETAAGHLPREVARAVSRAVAASLPSRPTVAVLITALDVPG
ncbi:hypothetical protein ACWGCP_33755, partial [Streptomyces niveus]